MATVTSGDIERMTDALYIDGPIGGRKSSKFWILLVLAGIIATAGVIADSTATVIGAMIVAPLMTPILGTALAIVLADRNHVLRCAALVIGGALMVIALAFLFGLVTHPLDGFVHNTQVASRISPKLIDLVAALATGTVGAFALVRSDISDTLPGVAIAISLVPPLAVVGLLLAVGRYADASEAALLFGTNVAAIIATGAVVLLLYRVRGIAAEAGLHTGVLRPGTVAIVAAMVVMVAIPLAVGTLNVAQDERVAFQARPVADAWAREAGWQVASLESRNGLVTITALGPPPDADPADLRKELNANGMADQELSLRLVVGGSASCPAGGTTCTVTARAE